MAKNKNDYFELMTTQTAFCVKASDLLEEILCNFSPENTNALRSKMHDIEHAADDVHHDILSKLYAEFITPIDQEDILHFVQIVDDITDAIDEVVMDFYMYDLQVLPAKADEFAKLVNRCVHALLDAVTEMKSFKKPEKLRTLLIAVNTVEGEADALYTEALHGMFATVTDAKMLIAGKAIFESLEHCCDLCEHAADVVEQIIIKNT